MTLTFRMALALTATLASAKYVHGLSVGEHQERWQVPRPGAPPAQ